MLEIMQIPDDKRKANATRSLRLHSSLLLANDVDERRITAEELDPRDPHAVSEQNAMFKEALPLRWPKFMGVFEHDGGPRKLVGQMKAEPVNMVDISHYFRIRPIDVLALAISSGRKQPLERYIGISALAADELEDQAAIIHTLLSTAIDPQFNPSERTYITLPPVDPAHEVAESLGFELAGTKTSERYGIPYTLFVRESQQNS